MNCLMCRSITEKISQQQLRHFFIVPSISVFKTEILLTNENDEVPGTIIEWNTKYQIHFTDSNSKTAKWHFKNAIQYIATYLSPFFVTVIITL